MVRFSGVTAATLVVVLLAGLTAGCSPTPTEPADVSAIVPLMVGNKWRGTLAPGARPADWLLMSEKSDVVATMQIGGEEWHHTTMHNFNTPGVGGALLRNRPDGLYIRSLSGDTSRRYLRYPAAIGDTVLDFGEYLQTFENGATGARLREVGVLERVDEVVTVPAGAFRCWRVRLVLIVVDDVGTEVSPSWGEDPEEGIVWYAPGIGPVKQGRTTWELTSYSLAR